MAPTATPTPRGFRAAVALPFAVDRMDTWVLRVSIAIPLVCLGGLVLWHVVSYLVGKLADKPRAPRQSPEPSAAQAPGDAGARGPAPGGDDPERLQAECLGLEGALAAKYVELAESWLHRGQPEKAAAAFRKVVLLCPDSPRARLAQDRLGQIGRRE